MRLRTSLWFVPSLIVAGAVALAIALIVVDNRLKTNALSNWPRLFGASADGTREMLSAVATTMITVAGVVFSVTIVTLSQAASQYTSRVLRNFMRDRSNQVVLGTFVGIYAYCLVVLRTVRGGSEDAFVPSLAAMGALVLAFAGIVVLIHFIHHVTVSIQATHILATIRGETAKAIERVFPQILVEGEREDDAEPGVRASLDAVCWRTVEATSTGYIQSVDLDALLKLACKHQCVVRLSRCVGEFVAAGETLVEAGSTEPIDDAVRKKMRRAISLGEQRTVEQDVAFGLRQIADIALKALSPAVNDPTTAIMCLDHLQALLVQLARRRLPPRSHFGEGKLRVVVERAPTFASLAEVALRDIARNAQPHPRLTARLLEVVVATNALCPKAARRSVLQDYAATVLQASDLRAD
jgi:uncharacterized membrane protein